MRLRKFSFFVVVVVFSFFFPLRQQVAVPEFCCGR